MQRGFNRAEALAGKLFTAFYRTRIRPRPSARLGIGLAACRRVIESLGGRIWAEPRDGGGTELGFALPLA